VKLRRILTPVLAVLLLGGLVGCQAIPGSGPVSEGLTDLSQAEQPVQFDPPSPVPGATPEEIVRGFVRAATSSVDDYAIAREFLAPDYADQWEPNEGVFIDDGAQPYTEGDEQVGTLTLSGIARVDATGTLTPLPAGEATEMRFEFVEVGGEWRISSAPNGIILDRNTFSAVWTPRQLYFLSADNRLVPETRWFLNRATLATQIVAGLLAGPSEVDAEALHTAFPSGTALTSRAVPISNGVAQIELSPELLTADPQTMEQLKRQLATSLQPVSGVTGYELSVTGATVDEGRIESPEGDSRSSRFQQPVVLQDGALGELASGEVTPLPSIGQRIVDLGPSAVSLNVNRTAAAVRHRSSGEQVVSWVSEDAVVTLDHRPGLLAPNLDPFGYVWSMATSDPTRVLVERPGSSSELLDLTALQGATPRALRVSPGGDRLAVLVRDGEQNSSVIVMSIVRDAGAVPLAVSELATRSMDIVGTPVDLDWTDELRLVALTKVGAGTKVTLGTLGHLPIDNGMVPDAVMVSGGGSRSLMRLFTSDHEIFAPQGSGWQRQASDIELLARVG